MAGAVAGGWTGTIIIASASTMPPELSESPIFKVLHEAVYVPRLSQPCPATVRSLGANCWSTSTTASGLLPLETE